MTLFAAHAAGRAARAGYCGRNAVRRERCAPHCRRL